MYALPTMTDVDFIIDCRPKSENVQQNLLDGTFCYKLPTNIFVEYMH